VLVAGKCRVSKRPEMLNWEVTISGLALTRDSLPMLRPNKTPFIDF
jgi:hypothetical protein